MQRISQSKDSEERHIVFLLTFTERWSAAASCQQGSLWGFLEPLPGLKWFTAAEVCVLTVHVLELTESLFSQQVHFYCVCLCAYVSGKEADDSGLNKTRWPLGGRDEAASVQMNTEAKILLLLHTVNFYQTHWQNPFFFFFTQKRAQIARARLTLQLPRVTSNPFPHLHPRLGIRFQAKSKQVTSLEVITQVAYLTGQTNMAASWHPEDRSKRGPDKEHSNARLVSNSHTLIFSH